MYNSRREVFVRGRECVGGFVRGIRLLKYFDFVLECCLQAFHGC